MMAYLTVREQDDRMRRVFPAFKLIFENGWWAVWEGPLTPICQTYRVRVRLIRRNYFDNFYLTNSDEKVTILHPPIGPDPRGTGEPPQHVYRLGYPDAFPRLCVHDPEQEEWTPEMSIADVLIPMVIKWLIFHEDWVDTGVWRGGGRHPEPRTTEDLWQHPNLSPDDPAQRTRSLSGAFHSLGRKLGVFGSYLWMAEGFEAHFPRPCWPNLNVVTGTVTEPPSTLILSPGLPPEVSSLSDLAPVSPERNSGSSTSNAAARYSRNESGRCLAA